MSERYYNSRQSNLDKVGEPESHMFARLRIKRILEQLGFEILDFAPEESKNKRATLSVVFASFDFKYNKKFDIVATKRLKNGILYRLIVEVDNLRLHGKKRQQNRDIKAKDLAELLFENVFVERIQKDFVNHQRYRIKIS